MAMAVALTSCNDDNNDGNPNDGNPTDTVPSAAAVAVTGVTLNLSADTLEVGDALQLTATVAPDSATNKGVSWASSNTAVATVANGLVTALGEGTAAITVTTADGGKKDTCLLTVKPESPISSARIRFTNADVYDKDEDMALVTGTSRDVPLTHVSGAGESVIYSNELADYFADYTCKIENGKFTLNLGAPKSELLDSMNELEHEFSPGIVVGGANAATAKGIMVSYFYEESDWNLISLESANKWVFFFYVDQAVTINGTGNNRTYDNVILTPGWNTLICVHAYAGVDTYTFTNGTPDDTYKWAVMYD